MPQAHFTDLAVRNLKPPTQGQVDYFEKLHRGLTLMLRVSYGGTKAWRIVTYTRGKPTVTTLGRFPEMSVAAARKRANGFNPKAAKAAAEAGTFKEVAEQWLDLYVDLHGLRTRDEIVRQLRTYVYPQWAGRPFFEIRRKDVNDLLDKIAKRGPSQADSVLATIRSIMNWYATRDDEYSSPIVKGMHRDRRLARERARQRVLTDTEIAAVWNASETCGSFGALVRLLLLTAQRREKIATMKWSDVQDGVWTIATERREKGNGGTLRLPPVALAIIEAQDELVGNDYIFPGTGQRHFSAWDANKVKLNAKLPPDMRRWTLHDLRRTARSLLSRLGIASELSERVLGHTIGGVQGTYDRHDYLDEKAEALDKLAKLIDRIVNPPEADNVIQFAK